MWSCLMETLCSPREIVSRYSAARVTWKILDRRFHLGRRHRNPSGTRRSGAGNSLCPSIGSIASAQQGVLPMEFVGAGKGGLGA